MNKVRGEWQQWQGRWVMPIFHPAYLLRNQSREVGSPKWLMWQDIQKIKAKYEELLGLSPRAIPETQPANMENINASVLPPESSTHHEEDKF